MSLSPAFSSTSLTSICLSNFLFNEAHRDKLSENPSIENHDVFKSFFITLSANHEEGNIAYLEAVIGAQETDSYVEKIQLAFRHAMGDRYGRELSPTEKGDLVGLYREEMLKIPRLTFWESLPGGKQFLLQNPDLRTGSPLELKQALSTWIIANCADITNLDLSNKQITALPPEIGLLTQLTRLDLSKNQLTTLPPTIGNLIRLQSLSVWNNQLATLPTQIGNLTQLTRLDLRLNRLTALPPEIDNLTQLEILFVEPISFNIMKPIITAIFVSLAGIGYYFSNPE